MKNYIANENGHWDTSKAHVRRLLDACIQYGRNIARARKISMISLKRTGSLDLPYTRWKISSRTPTSAN
jgi:hypothetical protein